MPYEFKSNLKTLYRISKRSMVLSPLKKRRGLGINEGTKGQKNDDSLHLKKNRLFGNFQLPTALKLGASALFVVESLVDKKGDANQF